MLTFSVKQIQIRFSQQLGLPVNRNPGLLTFILFTARTWSSWVISMPTVPTPRRPSCPPRPSTRTLCISGSSAWTPTPPRPQPTAPTTGSRCLSVCRLSDCLSIALSVRLYLFLSVSLSICLSLFQTLILSLVGNVASPNEIVLYLLKYSHFTVTKYAFGFNTNCTCQV